MKKLTIVWDFDGTILPHEPYDSEQSLLIHAMHRKQKPFGWLKKVYAKAIIYADQREHLRRTFKTSYIRLLKGTSSAELDDVCRDLAVKIPTMDRTVFRKLKEDGHDMMVLSCGTADLSERVLRFAGILNCFSLVEGNRFQFDEDHINGMELRMPDPRDKLHMMQKLNLSPVDTSNVLSGSSLMNNFTFPVATSFDLANKMINTRKKTITVNMKTPNRIRDIPSITFSL